MQLRSVLGKSIHDQWRAVLAWSLFAAVLPGIYVALYPAQGGGGALINAGSIVQASTITGGRFENNLTDHFGGGGGLLILILHGTCFQRGAGIPGFHRFFILRQRFGDIFNTLSVGPAGTTEPGTPFEFNLIVRFLCAGFTLSAHGRGGAGRNGAGTHVGRFQRRADIHGVFFGL